MKFQKFVFSRVDEPKNESWKITTSNFENFITNFKANVIMQI